MCGEVRGGNGGVWVVGGWGCHCVVIVWWAVDSWLLMIRVERETVMRGVVTGGVG